MPPELDDILSHIPDVILDVRYASTNNFTNKQLYTQQYAWLRHEPLNELMKVADELREAGYKLVIFDSYRPPLVQEKLKSAIDNRDYVLEISNHCKGITVDITLAYENGSYLDMGTDYDDFSEKAHSDNKLVTEEQKANRIYLANLMRKYGFEQYPFEWWHFDYRPAQAWSAIDSSINIYK